MSYAWVAGIAATVVSTAVSYSNAQKQNKLTKQSMEQAQRNADAAAKQADEDINRANMKSPDTAAMMSDAMLTGKQGVSGTMLTGAQGIGKDKLKLNKTTLLGG